MSKRDIYEDGFDEESGKTIRATTCPECPGTLVTDGGEISCVECGLVVDERRLDRGPDWFASDDGRSPSKRTGAPLTPARHDRGLSSEIGYGGDTNGKPLSGRKRSQIARLRRQDDRSRWRTKAEQNLAHACSDIARMTSALDLSAPVRDEACMIYRTAQRADLIRGRSIEAMAAASLYAACRCRGDPRTAEEVATVAQCADEKVLRDYRVLNAELGLETQLVGPRERIPRFASACGASARVRHRALELAGLAEETGVANGRHPAGVAAACLYLAGRECRVDYTQAELAEIADVTPVTLRERYHELRDVLAEQEHRI